MIINNPTQDRILLKYTEQELISLLKSKPNLDLQKLFNCSEPVITKFRKRFNLIRRGSVKRLQKRYRWLEDLDVKDLIAKVKKSNIVDVSKELNVPRHIIQSYLNRNGFTQDRHFKRSNKCWNKGLTKETSDSIKLASRKLSKTRCSMFKSNKLKRPDAFMTKEQIIARNRKGHETRKAKYGNAKDRTGKNNPAWGIKRPDLAALNRSRRGIPMSDVVKAKQSKIALRYWKSAAGIKQKANLSRINSEWALKHPDKKLAAAIKGHMACPRISSQERKFEAELKTRQIIYNPQFKFKLGVADFLIGESTIVFIDGKYWHNFPHGTEKDKKHTTYLTKCGYKVFRFWEHDINKDVAKCVTIVENYIKSKLTGDY